MKKNIFTLTLLAILFISCSKYEDGPKLSLKSPEKRIEGDWHIDEYTVDGVTIASSVFGDIVISYSDDNSYQEQTGSTILTGTWEFNDDKTIVHINYVGGMTQDFNIHRLTDDELWMDYTDDDDDGILYDFKCTPV